jgi:hypothetical protein
MGSLRIDRLSRETTLFLLFKPVDRKNTQEKRVWELGERREKKEKKRGKGKKVPTRA